MYNLFKRIKQWFTGNTESAVTPAEARYRTIRLPYKEATCKCELQIVFKNHTVLCTDYICDRLHNLIYSLNGTYKTREIDFEKWNPVQDYINRSFSAGIMHTFDKSNQYDTAIQTNDIFKILYMPKITVEEKIHVYKEKIEENDNE